MGKKNLKNFSIPLQEYLLEKKINYLDVNSFSYKKWQGTIYPLKDKNKDFVFKSLFKKNDTALFFELCKKVESFNKLLKDIEHTKNVKALTDIIFSYKQNEVHKTSKIFSTNFNKCYRYILENNKRNFLSKLRNKKQ